MLNIADREQKNKGNQNLKYSENFANFTTILVSFGQEDTKCLKRI